MTSRRFYYILLAAVILLTVGLIGGAYGASNILTEQSKSLLSARSKSLALDQQQTQLSIAKASVKKYKEISDTARSIVPQDKDQAQAVREIVKIAADNGITLGAITFPTSTLGGTTASGASSAAPGAGNAGAGALSQLTPAKGLTGVYTLQINVQSGSTNPTDYNRFVNFIAALENNRRTALVSAITIQPDSKDPTKVGFTLAIEEYIKP